METTHIKIECKYLAGVPHVLAKTAPATTQKFIEHLRVILSTPFCVTFNAGKEDGWQYDACELKGTEAEAAVTLFRS